MLRVYTLNESQKWDEIVKQFNNYDVYYLSGYVKAFKIHGDGEPLLFYYEDECCKGINVVMKRDIYNDSFFKGKITKNTYFDLATPYGYGGWIIEGKNYESLFIEYSNWCRNNNIVSEFVRFHPVLNNYVFSEGNYDVIPLGQTVAIDTTNKEAIWANFNPKNRNVIRKAINNGIEIKHDLNPSLIEEFIKIYNGTMDKDNAEEYYYFQEAFYKSILNDLKDNSTIFYAVLNDKIIASSIMIFENGKFNYHLSGSLREYQNLAPSNLLLWKAAEYANEIGCKTFHLGGGVGSAEDSLFKFKRAFYKGDLNRFYIGKIIFNNYKYNELLDMRVGIENPGYFPKYRG